MFSFVFVFISLLFVFVLGDIRKHCFFKTLIIIIDICFVNSFNKTYNSLQVS